MTDSMKFDLDLEAAIELRDRFTQAIRATRTEQAKTKSKHNISFTTESEAPAVSSVAVVAPGAAPKSRKLKATLCHQKGGVIVC